MSIYRESLFDEVEKCLGKRPATFSEEEFNNLAFLDRLVALTKSEMELRVTLPQDTAAIQVHALTLLDTDAVRAAEVFHNIVSGITNTRKSDAKYRSELSRKYRVFDFERPADREVIGLDAFNAKVAELVRFDTGADYRPEFRAEALLSKDDFINFAATVTSLGCLANMRISVCKLPGLMSTSYVGKSEIGVGFNGATADEILSSVRWAAKQGRINDELGHQVYSANAVSTKIEEGYHYALCSYAKAPNLNACLSRLSRKGVFSFEDRTLHAALQRKS